MPKSSKQKSRIRLTSAIKCQLENCRQCEMINQSNISVERSRLSLIHLAAEVGSYEVFNNFIKLGADIHARKPQSEETVLHSAMSSSNYDIIRYLIENGVDVNAASKSTVYTGETALHMAARQGTKEIIKLLLDNNANINAKCKNGITPFMRAVQNKNFEAMDALLEYSPDLFSTYEANGYTRTVFHLAILNRNWKMLDWLFEFADTVDANNNNNNLYSFFQSQSLLHFTLGFYSRNADIIKYLLDVGVDVNILDPFNKLAIEHQFASQHHPNCILLIKQHIVKLRAAGFYVSDRNIKAVSTGEFDYYLAECRLEVEKMKKNIIEGSRITFMEILHKNFYYEAYYLKSVDFVNILKRKPTFPEYPIYEGMIHYKLRRILKKVSCIKKYEQVIYSIFYELQLPCTFIRELYFYLSDNDLKKIIRLST